MGVVVTDRIVTSFDGTPIGVTTMWPVGASAASPVPFVLIASEWGELRSRSTVGEKALDLLPEGIGIVTFDSRGFGESGGEAHYASPAYEMRDAIVLVDFIASQLPVRFESPGDPVLGVDGRGHGAGLALLLAEADPRVDAVVSRDGWSDLTRALAPGGVPKLSRLRELSAMGTVAACKDGPRDAVALKTGCVADEVHEWWISSEATTRPSAASLAGWSARSPLRDVGRLRAPTLLEQGFSDTLYDARQAVMLYDALRAQATPVKLWLYDGGHGAPDTQAFPARQAATQWFRCHLLGACAGVRAGVDWFADDGVWRNSPAWPPAQVWRDTSFRMKPITGTAVPLVALKAVSANASCTPECRLVVDTASGAGGIFLRMCDAAQPCGLVAGSAQASIAFDGAGPDMVLLVGLATRSPDGTIHPLNDQLTPVRTSLPRRTAPILVSLPDVGARVMAPDQLVIHFQSADTMHAASRTPFQASPWATVHWPSSV